MTLPAVRPVIFLKAHVRGYTRKDGTTVAPHEDKRRARKDIDPAKVFGQLVAPLAIQAYGKLGVMARDAVDHWNVNW